MITIRKAADRGLTRLDWLDSRHSFSFADYRDPAHDHFGPLRVINDDRIDGGGGFRPHSHRDMEIVTYVIEGALAHEDSTGGRGTINAGEVQYMCAGTGITHSEFNASESDPCRLLQLWIIPDKSGHAPGYQQKRFRRDDKVGRLVAVASGRGRDGALVMHRDADIFASVLEPGGSVAYAPETGRRVWLQVATGSVAVDGRALSEGDGAAIEGAPDTLEIASPNGAEFLLFDLP